jgi:hypothetical protein
MNEIIGEIPDWPMPYQFLNGPLDGKEIIIPAQLEAPLRFNYNRTEVDRGSYILCVIDDDPESGGHPAYYWQSE